MPSIDDRVALAFANKKDISVGNTVVKNREVFLHGNKIAWVDRVGVLCISHAGWVTRTTKNRLDAVLTAFGQPYTVSIRRGRMVLVHTDGWLKVFDDTLRLTRSTA